MVDNPTPEQDADGHCSRRRFYLVLTLSVFAAQCTLLSIVLPIGDLFSDEPIFYYDTAYHWYEIWFSQAISGGRNWIGYDPYFSAGMVNGVNMNFSQKAGALIAILGGPTLSPALAYKLVLAGMTVIAPGSVVVAAHYLGLRRPVGAVAALLAVMIWWASDLRSYMSIGMVTWSGACLMAIPYAVLSLRYLTRDTTSSTLIALATIAACLTFVHPAFPVPVALGLSVMACLRIGKIDWSRAAAYAFVVAVATVSLNYFWISATTEYAPSAVGAILPAAALAEVDILLPVKLMLGRHRHWPSGSTLYLLLCVFGAFACFAASSVRDRANARALFAACIVLILFGAVGAAVPGLEYSQPNRYSQAGFSMAILPASIGIVALFRRVVQGGGTPERPLQTGLYWTIALLGAAGLIFYANEVRREVSSEPIGHYGGIPPEIKGVGKLTMEIRRWIEGNTDESGRILFEVTFGNKLDSAQIVGWLAATTGREFIGGPYPRWEYVGFEDATAFGAKIEEIPPARFLELLQLYNVSWVAAWHPRSRQYLDKHPDMEGLEEVGPMRFYRVKREASYFLVGTGKVASRAPNSLSLEELSGPEVVLKYHFVKGLVTEPKSRIEPVAAGSTVPFIRLIDPPPRLRIFLDR